MDAGPLLPQGAAAAAAAWARPSAPAAGAPSAATWTLAAGPRTSPARAPPVAWPRATAAALAALAPPDPAAAAAATAAGAGPEVVGAVRTAEPQIQAPPGLPGPQATPPGPPELQLPPQQGPHAPLLLPEAPGAAAAAAATVQADHRAAVAAGKLPAIDAAPDPAWPGLGMSPTDAPISATALRGHQADAALAAALLAAKSEASAAQE